MPFDPAPRHVVRVPALERSRDVLRQLGVHRIDRKTVDDEALREIADDEADGERDEGSGADACKKLRREERGEIGRKGRKQAGDEQERHSVQKDSPDAENGAEIGAGDADQHLADAEARRHPCAFVEPEVQPPRRSASPKVVMRLPMVERSAPIRTPNMPT